MKKIFLLIAIFMSFFSFLPIITQAANAVCTSPVYMRSGPATTYGDYELIPVGTEISILDKVSSSDSKCASREWLMYNYNGKTGYSCSSNFDTTNKYNRPWNTPGKSIYNGAKWIASGYISKGQFTSYFTRFNVNPNSSYSVYSHQYMYNVRGAWSEAYRTYLAYSNNDMLNNPLVFTIPIFNNMPDGTQLPNGTPTPAGEPVITDLAFEAKLDEQQFNETYKARLRELHKEHPQWIFESLRTGLDWNDSVIKTQRTSYIDSSNSDYWESSTIMEGTNWRYANLQTTAYYLDPRNFLNEERVFMFLKLSYSSVETEEVISSMLKNTFMAGTSSLDNKTYAKLFYEAGSDNNVSPIFLVSKVIQEVSSSGSAATTGAPFSYNGKEYSGIYNFYNIGANNNVYDGLFWASIGFNSSQNATIEDTYLNALGLAKRLSFATGVNPGTTVSQIKGTNQNLTIKLTDASDNELGAESTLGTGAKMVIFDGTNNYNYQIVIFGDISGDSQINAIDLLLLRKKLLGTQELTGANLEAAKIAKGDSINALDLLYLRRFLIDSNTYNINQ